MRTIRVASRTSELAMTQTQWVIQELLKINSDFDYTVVPITTKGDRILDVTLSKVGGKGLFVSEIEQAILTGVADMAVHSLKDVPHQVEDGLVIAGIPQREDPRDVLVSKESSSISALRDGATIGTSSLRRLAQIRHCRPDIRVESLRGNINTRLRRAEMGDFDGIILAAAGLLRMGWGPRINEYLPVDVCVPAIGQGALAVECREDDSELIDCLRSLSHAETVAAVTAERSLLRALDGSCQVPIAGYAVVLDDGQLQLTGLVAHPDGSDLVQTTLIGEDPVQLGQDVARRLIANGAQAWIELARNSASENV